jgi:hypothetical protein
MVSLTMHLAASASGHYLNWSVIHISLTNALIILAMVVIFGLALLLPFPTPPDREQEPNGGDAS